MPILPIMPITPLCSLCPLCRLRPLWQWNLKSTVSVLTAVAKMNFTKNAITYQIPRSATNRFFHSYEKHASNTQKNSVFVKPWPIINNTSFGQWRNPPNKSIEITYSMRNHIGWTSNTTRCMWVRAGTNSSTEFRNRMYSQILSLTWCRYRCSCWSKCACCECDTQCSSKDCQCTYENYHTQSNHNSLSLW